MKHIITVFLITIGLFAKGQGGCDVNALADTCKHHLKPFVYDASNAQHISLKSVPQEKEINFPAFSGQHYRIIINLTSMPKGTQVAVYDQDETRKKRKMLYTFSDPGGQLGTCDLESRTGRLFIDYSIPAASPKLPPSGCAVVLFGYENSK